MAVAFSLAEVAMQIADILYMTAESNGHTNKVQYIYTYVVTYVKHGICRENFVMFINCVSVINLVVVRYLFSNMVRYLFCLKQFKENI